MTKTIAVWIAGALAAVAALFAFGHDLHCHTSGVCHSHPQSEVGHEHGHSHSEVTP